MAKTAIQKLGEFGQSAWFDNISRSLIESGELKEMIAKGIRGMTSNPTIFDNAISKSNSYDEAIAELVRAGKSTFEIYDDLTIRDIQDAADLFRPLYDRTNGLDGYVSLEINPLLALKVEETIKEGRRLFNKVDRPNVMFKVPATEAGFKAVEEFLAAGMNINVTLIFSLEQYSKTVGAFLQGLKRLSKKTNDLSVIGSVASIFVSRIDTAVDKLLDELITQESHSQTKDKLQALKGKAAVANSRLIFGKYSQILSGNEFQELKAKGARCQRVLWASTGTKNPSYSDIKYITELIAKNTVNTAPSKTIEAFIDHGIIKESVTSDVTDAREVINSLNNFGIDINSVCRQLLKQGVIAFEKSFKSLLSSIEEKSRNLCRK